MSKEAELTPAPRLTGICQSRSSWTWLRYETHKSLPPKPPGRLLLKNNQWPSRDRAGTFSMNAVFTVPTFVGSPHAPSTVSRWDTQMSKAPEPPGRVDPKYRLRPSLEMAGA